MIRHPILAVLLGLSTLTLPVQDSYAMFDKFKLCVFSAVSGVVIDRGQPVNGAKVVRRFRWHWRDEDVRDEAITDKDGRFQFPALYRTSVLAALLPHEPVIEQLITISHDSKEYMAWSVGKRDYDEDTESDGKPANITCRLENERTHHGRIYGICEPN